jgi:methylase of polypeptide subunit release factors
VRGERFDLIMCHPPYVPEVSSVAGTNYWSGGVSGLGIVKPVLAGAAAHLKPGGVLLMRVLLAKRRGVDPIAWIERFGHRCGLDLNVAIEGSDLMQLAPSNGDYDWDAKRSSWEAQGIYGFVMATLTCRLTRRA